MQQPQTTSSEIVCPEHRAVHPQPIALRKILVIVDPAMDEQPAIDKAARIAAGTGARLELYTCDSLAEDPISRVERQRGLIDALEDLAAPLRARGLAVAVSCEFDTSLERGIGVHAIRTKPDLVVKEVHRPDAPHRGSLALLDWNLIREIAQPLLLVRSGAWPMQPSITVAADPCRGAERPESLDSDLVTLGSLFANALDGELTVVHVLQSAPHLPGEAVSSLEQARAHGRARDAVERIVVEAANCGGPVPIHFIEGRVAETMVGFAAEYRPNVMILGSSARPRWAFASASGTAAEILDSLVCDLLIAKPAGFVSPLLVTD